MLLALDIGNNAVKGGFFRDERVTSTFRVPTGSPEWKDELRGRLTKQDFARAAMCSVVPALTKEVSALVQSVTGSAPLIINHQARLPFEAAYEAPETLGTDRLAAAAAAYARYGRPQRRSLIVVDAGTAVTYEVINREGVYLGGAIGPGPRVLAQSLHDGTAQLPATLHRQPDSPIGRTTVEAVESGVWWAFIDSVAGMIARLEQSLDEVPLRIATGGESRRLESAGVSFHHLDPLLVLRGIALLTALSPSPSPASAPSPPRQK